jgi:hypothetical protein
MVRLYQALIRTNVGGGNIPVKIYANSVNQARDLIQKLPYFQNFIGSPSVINEATDYDDLFGIEI